MDDVDEAFVNGKKIGMTGSMPDSEKGLQDEWQADRWYVVDLADGSVNLNGDNVLAIRVYNDGGDGGMYHGPVTIAMPS
ncbi:MAG: alpha-galactosidase, partial [Prevotellaceae bacterium]|nr:alpha-galactosidase [Prevotellaceae bacterium]